MREILGGNMQTFLPYPDFSQSAQCLDNKRLAKQRVECYQILKALLDSGYGWQNHPAVKMWRGYELALFKYATAICQEWTGRGYRDTCQDKMIDLMPEEMVLEICLGKVYYPDWLGNEAFHSTHRAILLAKSFNWYDQFNWTEQPAVKVKGKWSYIWP